VTGISVNGVRDVVTSGVHGVVAKESKLEAVNAVKYRKNYDKHCMPGQRLLSKRLLSNAKIRPAFVRLLANVWSV
jgi:hypothetical protein